MSPSAFKISHFLHPDEGINLFASQGKYNYMSPISEVKRQWIFGKLVLSIRKQLKIKHPVTKCWIGVVRLTRSVFEKDKWMQ